MSRETELACLVASPSATIIGMESVSKEDIDVLSAVRFIYKADASEAGLLSADCL